MNITTSLHEIGSVLEEKGLVKHSKATIPTIHGFTFKQIKECCSLSNQSIMSLLFNRLSIFFKTWQWLNDAKIGTHLFHEYVWVNSKVAYAIKHQDYEQKDVGLAQINLIDSIFTEIIMKHYQKGVPPKAPDVIPIPHKNSANPTIAKMFPIQWGSDVGASLAERLSINIQKIQNLFSQACPHNYLLEKANLRREMYGVLDPACFSKDKINPIERVFWTQHVDNLLTFMPPSHEAKGKVTYEEVVNNIRFSEPYPLPNVWWEQMKDQDKINMICDMTFKLEEIDKNYSIQGKALPPYKIKLKAS